MIATFDLRCFTDSASIPSLNVIFKSLLCAIKIGRVVIISKYFISIFSVGIISQLLFYLYKQPIDASDQVHQRACTNKEEKYDENDMIAESVPCKVKVFVLLLDGERDRDQAESENDRKDVVDC